MMKLQKNIYSTLILSFILSCSTAALKSNSLSDCLDQVSVAKPYSVGELKINFTMPSPGSCPAQDFPSIYLNLPEVSHWIQFVRVAPFAAGQTELSDNLTPGTQTWTFLDLTPDQRKQKTLFTAQGSIFFDNPKWSISGKINLNWTAHLYAVIKLGPNQFKITHGVRWGYTIAQSTVIAVEPQMIPSHERIQDMKWIKELSKNWSRPTLDIELE